MPKTSNLGIRLFCSVIILAVAAEIIYFIQINPDVGYGIMGVLIFLIFFFLLTRISLKIRKIIPGFKRSIDSSTNTTSHASNLLTVLVLGIMATMLPSLLYSYFWEAKSDNFTILNIVILPILTAIIFWGLAHYFKKLSALNSFSKWKKLKINKP
jgi:hypothetical protein